MILRDIEFPNIMMAAGISGYFSNNSEWFEESEEGFFTVDKSGLGFVTTTCTANLNLHYDGKEFTTAQKKSDSIKVKILSQNVLKAERYYNPGIDELLKTGRWQKMYKPYFISVKCIKDSWAERMAEIKYIVNALSKRRRYMYNYGIEIDALHLNYHNVNDLINHVAELDVPIVAKISIDKLTVEDLLELEKNPHMDAISLSESVYYHWNPDTLFYGNLLASEWNNNRPFGKYTPEPFCHRNGDGELSGNLIRPFVLFFIQKLREAGFEKPIIGGGGILEAQHVVDFKNAGANAVFVDSATMLRPYKVEAIIEEVNMMLSRSLMTSIAQTARP